MKKKYRKIPSLNYLYEISQDGELRNVKSKRVQQVYENWDGYIFYSINNQNFINKTKRATRFQHRLIAEVWIKRPEHLKDIPFNKLQINHKNYIKDDNRIENLEWCTQSENQIHSYIERKQRPQTKKAIESWKRNLVMDGSNSPKLPVKCVETGVEYKSAYEAARWVLSEYGFNTKVSTIAGKIRLVAHGHRKKAYKHTWEKL